MVKGNKELDILNKLVGRLDETLAAAMEKKTDCYLHPSVSLFMPASGQCQYAISPNHTHPAYSFIYYLQPDSEIIVEGKKITFDFSRGKCLCAFSPEIPHQEIEKDTFESYIAILIDGDMFRRSMEQFVKPVPVFRGEVFVPHPELLGMLRCFMLEADDHAMEAGILDHLAAVITHLISRSVITETFQTIPLYNHFEIGRSIAYMNSHFAEKITLEALAERVSLSAGHFSKLFKSVTGATPIDFLNMLRLRKARNMLMYNTESITEIALQCGFSSSSYFSACFIEKYYMTPTEYRIKMNRKSQDFNK